MLTNFSWTGFEEPEIIVKPAKNGGKMIITCIPNKHSNLRPKERVPEYEYVDVLFEGHPWTMVHIDFFLGLFDVYHDLTHGKTVDLEMARAEGGI